MDERLQIFQDKMEKSLANLNEEFAGIRAGRANPHVLDKLRVDITEHRLRFRALQMSVFRSRE